jgi:outer membrane immunogenic protein
MKEDGPSTHPKDIGFLTRSAHFRPLAKVGAVGALLALTISARAADLGPTGAPPSPAAAATISPWTGFYAGAVYGAGYSSVRSSQTVSRTASTWGQTSGALVGYAFQSGPLVYGPEGEFNWHVLRPENGGASGLAESVNDTLETFRLRARVGYDLGQFLPYIAGGVASGKIYQYLYPWPSLEYGQSRQETGLTLGAGLEWRFVAPVFGLIAVRGEYIYDAYPTETFALDGVPMRSRASEQFFRVGLIDYPDETWRPPAASAGAPDWSGAYAGALVGDLWAQPRTSLGGATTTDSASGPAGGIFTGRNFMFGPWMLGYEGAAEATDATGTGPQPSAAAVSFRNYFETDLRGRAGYAIGSFLPYVTAGADWGRSEQTDLNTGSYRGRIWSDSVAGGAGVEYMFNDRWSARVEFLVSAPYTHAATDLDALALEQSRPAQTIRVGLGYYFH